MASGNVPLLVAKVLQRCGHILDGSEEAVKNLWLASGLHWEDLGKGKEDLEEFLEKHVCEDNVNCSDTEEVMHLHPRVAIQRVSLKRAW